jgi:NAD(P)-dependent dehydrogenase (short-subunit alcohol dehydrogenase family)
MHSTRVAQRVAVVTGATKGIGLGIARGLGEAGWRVHVTGRTKSGPGSLDAAVAAIQAAGGQGVAHVVDHSDSAATESLFQRVFATETEGVDLLVNNVYPAVSSLGDTLRTGVSKFWQLPSSNYSDTNDVGVTAHYEASVHYAREMVPKGRGLIVMVSSPGGLFYFFTAAYSTGKAALDRLTTDLAHELRGTGVGCCGLYPGLVATEKFEEFAKEGLWTLTPERLATAGETPLYSGRAVAALAADCAQPARQRDFSGTIHSIA